VTYGAPAVIALAWAVELGSARAEDDSLDDRLAVRATDRVELLEDPVTGARRVNSVPVVDADVTDYGTLMTVLEATPMGSVDTPGVSRKTIPQVAHGPLDCTEN
jgi:hypothetical protein